jgi:hypothetical protein
MNAEILFNKSNERIKSEDDLANKKRLIQEQQACDHIDKFLKMEFKKDTFKFPLIISVNSVIAELLTCDTTRNIIIDKFFMLLKNVIKNYETDNYELYIQDLSHQETLRTNLSSEVLLNSRLKIHEYYIINMPNIPEYSICNTK